MSKQELCDLELIMFTEKSNLRDGQLAFERERHTHTQEQDWAFFNVLLQYVSKYNMQGRGVRRTERSQDGRVVYSPYWGW